MARATVKGRTAEKDRKAEVHHALALDAETIDIVRGEGVARHGGL
jgi:hypothetical protein